MRKRLTSNMFLKTVQYMLIALVVFVQGQAAVKATEHAASGGLGYLCGESRLPPAAVANIKYLLALQGEEVDGTAADCEFCFNFAATETDTSYLNLPIFVAVSGNGAIIEATGPDYRSSVFVPVGLRAPPIF